VSAWRSSEPDTWEILPGSLWQSGSPVNWTAVGELAIDTVVDVNGDGDRRLEPVGWFRSESILYLFWPLADARLPDPTDLTQIIDVIIRRIGAGHRVLVCCSQGLNRSGLLSAAVIQAARGGTGAEALEYLEERRTRPMSNPAFIDYVRSLPVSEGPAAEGDRTAPHRDTAMG
jgi:Dual specificity phosphatase, catalytic domain